MRNRAVPGLGVLNMTDSYAVGVGEMRHKTVETIEPVPGGSPGEHVICRRYLKDLEGPTADFTQRKFQVSGFHYGPLRRDTTFYDFAELFEGVECKPLSLAEVVPLGGKAVAGPGLRPSTTESVAAPHFGESATTTAHAHNAFVCGAETATGDRTTVIGRRVIKDLGPSIVMGGMPSDGAMDPNWGNRSFVIGDMGCHTGHYRFPEPSLIGYWRMLSGPTMQSPLLGRLRLTWCLAMRKARRRLSLSYGSTRPF